MAAEILRFDKDQAAVADQDLGPDRRVKIAECDDRIFRPHLKRFLACGQFVRVESKRFVKTLVEQNRNADIFFADEFFELIDGQQQAFGFGPRDGIKAALTGRGFVK